MARSPRSKGALSCIAAITEASGGKLDQDEIEEIVDAVDRSRRRLTDAGDIDNLDAKLAQAAVEEANKVKVAAILAKKNAALTIIARDRTDAHIGTLESGGLTPKKAVLAVFEGTAKGISMARKSIYATKLAFEGRFIGQMMSEVIRAVPGADKIIRDAATARDIVREMFELREGGVPGRTGNRDAQTIAKVFAKHAEISRRDLNALGANIGKLDDWGGPHAHDATKLMRVTDDEWANRIATRLDLNRTFPDLDPVEARAVLKETYLTITTGKSRALTAARRGQFQGPRNLARSLSKDRVLHFKSADDWLAYQTEFGHGNIWTGMLTHQRKMALKASMMQMLGPNPRLLMASVLDKMQERIRNDPALTVGKKNKQIADLSLNNDSLWSSSIGQAMLEAEGVTGGVAPGGETAARIFGGYRATQSMAKLGGAVISSIQDFVTQAANLRYQGVPLLRSYHDQTVQMIGAIARQTSTEEKHIAYLVGEGLDGMLDNIHATAYAEDSLPGAMTSAMSKFFRWSGLTFWTDNVRGIGARMMAAHVGSLSAKAFGDLPDAFRHVINQHGIGENEWNVIRESAYDGPRGNRYVTPDRISALPDDRFAPFIQGEVTPSKLARAKLNAELALGRFYADEINFGVIETDAASRRFVLRGTQAGTVPGELLRAIGQFKGWPVAFTQRTLGRALFGQRSGTEAAIHIAHILAASTVAGYLAMTAKDYIRGYDRRKFTDDDGSVNLKTLTASLAQGGGAGIYGDYLFGNVSRFGSGPLETVAGPGIGTAADLVENLQKARDGNIKAADWLNFALQNTPFVNLAYVRPVVDYMVLNELRESISPGFLQRQRVGRKNDYGQSLLWPQTLSGTQ